ncbi:hypothetical protein [Streptomyces sp. NPDC048521]
MHQGSATALADGLRIEAELSNGRIASTRGHDARYMKIVPGCGGAS